MTPSTLIKQNLATALPNSWYKMEIDKKTASWNCLKIKTVLKAEWNGARGWVTTDSKHCCVYYPVLQLYIRVIYLSNDMNAWLLYQAFIFIFWDVCIMSRIQDYEYTGKYCTWCSRHVSQGQFKICSNVVMEIKDSQGTWICSWSWMGLYLLVGLH